MRISFLQLCLPCSILSPVDRIGVYLALLIGAVIVVHGDVVRDEERQSQVSGDGESKNDLSA